MTKKERLRSTLISYLANCQAFPPRSQYYKALRLDSPQTMYAFFTSEELCQIEREALTKYEKNSYRFMSQVHKAVLDKALSGDMKAAELYYRRVGAWLPTQAVEVKEENQLMLALARVFRNETLLDGPKQHRISHTKAEVLDEIIDLESSPTGGDDGNT